MWRVILSFHNSMDDEGGGGGGISSLFGEKGGYLLFLKGQGFLPISFLEEGYLFFLKGQGISANFHKP